MGVGRVRVGWEGYVGVEGGRVHVGWEGASGVGGGHVGWEGDMLCAHDVVTFGVFIPMGWSTHTCTPLM